MPDDCPTVERARGVRALDVLRLVEDDLKNDDAKTALARIQAYREIRSSLARAAGKKGGEATVELHGSAHLSAAGEKGGAATSERYGPMHYSRIGQKGGVASSVARGKREADS